MWPQLLPTGMPKKVICALSGGVDSSVAAALLKKQGFNVLGIFLKFSDSLCFKESEKKAKQIAKILGIPLLTLDSKKEFKEKVINYFLEECKKGRTPNPCIVCNKEMKFGFLFKKALTAKADYLATGHYARIKNYKLLKAKDKEKDQSYFLWSLKQSQLKHILFPVGNYRKSKVKKLAEKFGILKYVRPESKDICFVQTSLNDFLAKNIKPKPGKIVDSQGRIIGRHQGLIFYTIGQRKEIRLSGGPFWVLTKDRKRNFLIVTKNEKDLFKKELIVEKVNWILGKPPKLPLKIKAKIRYLHKPASAVLTLTQMFQGSTSKHSKHSKYYFKDCYRIIFKKAQRAITPGQSVVFYSPSSSLKAMVRGRYQEVLGGGIIK